MKLKTIREIKINLKNKKVLLRVDFNVPIKNGKVVDDWRIQATLPTIKYLIDKRAKIILISHLGDPLQNKKQYSLRPVYNNLKFKIKNLKFIDDCLGEKTRKIIEKMRTGEVILLENLRFYPGEKENDKNFAKELAKAADLYVNDAFAVSHRAHASVSAITRFLPSYAGFLLEKEVKTLSEILEKPKHPLIVLIGGAKISTKIKVIENLARRADKILLGGALANTFFVGQGYQVGGSLYEKEMISVARQLMRRFKEKIVLPSDVKIKLQIVNRKLRIVKINELNKFKKFQILDIGAETIKLFSNYLKNAKMIVWNGPVGLIEKKPFDEGTKKIAEIILKNKRAKIVIGGGETIASLKNQKSKIRNNVFISTGGGAMLEFLEGKILPGIRPLLLKKS